MKTQFIGAVSTILLILFFSSNPAFCSDEAKCECDFDTTSYTAECDCAMACAVAMDRGKYCSIVCDGAPTNATDGNKAVFGNSRQYLAEMASIRREMFSGGYRVPMAADNNYFRDRALPRLFRSSYISAPFLTEEEVVKLDNQVNKAFSKFQNEIWKHFVNEGKERFEKQLDGKDSIEVTYKTIRLRTPLYTFKFSILK